jgi:hypothetical protein
VTLLTAAAASHGRLLGTLASHVAFLVAVATLHGWLLGTVLGHVTLLAADMASHAIHGARFGAISLVVAVDEEYD